MEGGWWANLTACWDVVSASVSPTLGQLGSWTGCWPYFGLGQQQELVVNGRRFRVAKLLGEGGYSFVYLVQELPTPLRPAISQRQYALKKVLIGSPEAQAAAEREIAVMRRLHHPHLLPLLDASMEEAVGPDGELRRAAHMLFPLYEVGSLWDLVHSKLQQGTPLPLQELLLIFVQVCAALQAMHSMEPALAHRDVKPQNVLLRRRRRPGGASGAGSGATSPPRQQQLGMAPAGPSGASKKNNGGAVYSALPVSSVGVGPAGLDEEDDSEGEEGLEMQRLAGGGGNGSVAAEGGSPASAAEYHAVLMDFGSTRPARVEVFNRIEAMAVQEDAEAHCTAPYRAPELWDPPSTCSLDERVDVWSAGCLLYFMLAGESPFERVLGEAGGSLMLAVANGRVSWPPEWQDRYPQAVQDLVMSCLTTDPAARPFIAEVKLRAEQLALELMH